MNRNKIVYKIVEEKYRDIHFLFVLNKIPGISNSN